MEYGQRRINMKNAAMNHAFTIGQLPLNQKLRYAVGTSLYGSNRTQGIANKMPIVGPLLRHNAETGLVHLYASELQSVADAKKNITEIRKSASRPVLISADIEGGLIRHFRFTEQDLRQFEIPERILVERRNEHRFYLEKHAGDASKVRSIEEFPLPSQEWLGRVYLKLTTDSARQQFLQDIQGYGRAVALLCEHVGINVVFGPNLDIVENIDGDRPDEKNDRSFGTRSGTVSALARAYIRGFKESASVVVVPKHFVGSSLADTDPHTTTATAVIDRRSGALIPYRDVINDAISPELSARQIADLEARIATIEARNAEYTQRLATVSEKDRARLVETIAANERNITLWRARIEQLKRDPESRGSIGGMMTAVTSNGLWGDEAVPSAFSRRTLRALTGPKSATALGLKGPAFTDDLSMASAQAHIHAIMQQRAKQEVLDPQALAIHQALAAGNSVALIRGIAGKEALVLSEVAKYIQSGLDMNNDGRPDLTEAEVDALVKKVLDLQVQVGLLQKQTIRGEEYYVLPPTFYNPTTLQVLLNSFFSNQWPFLSNDTPAPNPERKPSVITLAEKAAKNFLLSLLRVNVPHINPTYETGATREQHMIVVDKSAQHMWIYDAKTRTLKQSFDIAIGRGGLQERRHVGDHVTPTGTYQVVGKRDAAWWKADGRGEFPAEYGGGMLVLAGQWHPEIAIHGSPPLGDTGQVSNGCVRVPNEHIDTMLHQIPVGTMVIITK
jgi:beta-glucosidase-like glycosyl hydrolase